MAHHRLITHPLVLRRVSVQRVQDVTPRMRRITIGGPDLGEVEAAGTRHRAFTAPGFDDHIKLIFASGDDLESALPIQLPHGIEWPPSDNRRARDYTPRRVDTAAAEIDLDLVLHGDGPAVAWARRAAVGDQVCFVGPKSSTVLPGDLDWILLAGDETALPAIGRFLDERPTDAPARIVITVESDRARQELAVRDTDMITWVRAAGTDAEALESAVRAMRIPVGNGYAWCAAESRVLLPLRRYLRHQLGLDKSRMNVTGYWHAEQDHQPAATAAAEPAAPASPLPWLITRAAVQLGVIDHLAGAGRAVAVEEVAAKSGVDVVRLELLLPVLLEHGVLRRDGLGLGLGPAGDLIAGDEHAREEYDGLEAELMLALSELAGSLPTGGNPWRMRTGRSLRATADADPELFDELRDGEETLRYLLHALAAEPWWSEIGQLVITGPGALAVADLAREQADLPRISITEADGPLSVLRERADADVRTGIDWRADVTDADAVVAALALQHRDDAEAVALLRSFIGRTERVVLIEHGRPDGLSPHAAEIALLAHAGTGAGLRDDQALAALASSAGWQVDRVLPLGWGIRATLLVPLRC